MTKSEWLVAALVAVAIVLILLLTFGAWPAGAQHPMPQCQKPQDMADALWRGYREIEVMRGIGSRGKVLVQVYASDGGSWTVVETRAGGLTCIVGGGSSWEAVRGQPGEES